MSYCRKEGKDIIIFATEEDLSGPSSTQLLPDNPDEIDSSSQSAILPNGEINWDCPCLGNLPHGPCGESFREAFSCWAQNKDSHESFAEQCFEGFTKWEGCLAEHRDIYKSSSRQEDSNEKEEISSDAQNLEALNASETKEPTYTQSISNTGNRDFENRKAISAASVDNPIK